MSIEALAGFNMPTIVFNTKAITWITAIVDVHSDEVGFYCTVDEDKENNVYTITDVFYPKHDLATAVTCEISVDGLSDIGNYLLDNGREDDIGKLKVWGHSHHTMGTSPSQQDENTGLELATDNGDFLIRLIANKKGEMNITFYDMINKVRYTKMGYSIQASNEEAYPLLVDMASVINDNTINNSTKLSMITDIVEQGVEDNYGDIRKRVTEMKKINIPAKTVYSYGHNNKVSKTKVVNQNTPSKAAKNTPVPANVKEEISKAMGYSKEEELAFERELEIEHEMLMEGHRINNSIAEYDEFDAIEEFNSGGINERFQ